MVQANIRMITPSMTMIIVREVLGENLMKTLEARQSIIRFITPILQYLEAILNGRWQTCVAMNTAMFSKTNAR